MDVGKADKDEIEENLLVHACRELLLQVCQLHRQYAPTTCQVASCSGNQSLIDCTATMCCTTNQRQTAALQHASWHVVGAVCALVHTQPVQLAISTNLQRQRERERERDKDKDID